MLSQLSGGIVDVYYARLLDLDSGLRRHFLTVLNDRELLIYNRFLLEQRKTEYLVGRYLLKNILAHHLNTTPGKIQFIRNTYGKPYLPDKIQCRINGKIKFNLSHSHGIVACAVTLGHEVGIDLEKVDGNLLIIAERFFSPAEIRYIFAQQKHLQNEAAYRIWTLKEAYIKAKGIGLSMGLRSFNIFEVKEMYFKTIVKKPEFYLSVAVENKGELEPRYRVNEIIL